MKGMSERGDNPTGDARTSSTQPAVYQFRDEKRDGVSQACVQLASPCIYGS